MKSIEGEMKQEKTSKIEAEKQARLDRKRRREENELKNIQYQIITNNKKLKAMSKKEKRNIMKMDVTNNKFNKSKS
eukprot:TRINITY_DN1002_c0_g1_i2.p2 TRINITY_DN1002_c0_g1~~TRINITY_DN1002_c0_g1_i2.p2  ORF type:complete len:76 (-),score=12.87 TRINITY_DN1002_c0_g1_i2:7-234(-)